MEPIQELETNNNDLVMRPTSELVIQCLSHIRLFLIIMM